MYNIFAATTSSILPSVSQLTQVSNKNRAGKLNYIALVLSMYVHMYTELKIGIKNW